MTLNVFSLNYPTITLSSLQSSSQLAKSVSSQKLFWMKLEQFEWIIFISMSLVFSLHSRVVEVLSDLSGLTRDGKEELPSLIRPLWVLSIKIWDQTMLQCNRWNHLCSTYWIIHHHIYQVHVFEASRWEEGTARPSYGN